MPHYIDQCRLVCLAGFESVVKSVCVCAAGSKRLSLFISRGATQILLHVLVCESKDDDCLSELLVAVHQLLAKLGTRGNHQHLVSL